MKAKVAIDLTEYNEDSVAEEIVKSASERLSHTLGEKISDLANSEFKKMIESRVAEIVDKVFADGIRKSNPYGEAISDTKTWTEFAAEETKRYLAEWVDSRGDKRSYHRDGCTTRAQYIARQIMKDTIMGNLDAIKDSVKEEIAGQLKAALATIEN